MKKTIFFLLLAVLPVRILAQIPEFPLHASKNGRYLVDKNNNPFFYQAETPWMIFINLNEIEMGDLMDIRVRQGFNVLQTMALHLETNVNGDKPFEDNDFTKPNMAYFEHILKGIRLAEQKGLLVGLVPVWKGCCNTDWSDIILQNGTKKCREYGQFLGKYFASCKNLFWIHGGDNDPAEHINHYRQIAFGIREYMPDVMQTYHASTGHTSSDVVNYRDNSWLNFIWTYTYYANKHNVWMYLGGFGELPEVYEMNHDEYHKYPVMPFVLGESQYEGEDLVSYKPQTAVEVVRRQAYWSVLSGGCGHAYGSWNWPVNKDWRKVEEDSGAWQMGHVRKFFESFTWYDLVPDLEQDLLVTGAGTYGNTDYATAAFLPDFSIVAIYIPPTGKNNRNLSVDVSKMSGEINAQWFNPVSGKYTTSAYTKKNNVLHLTTPGAHGDGSNDWILLLKNVHTTGTDAPRITPATSTWQGKPADFSHGKLRVSDNGHFLQHADGKPFFYLGETGWELFHRLNREEATYYLKKRASLGFNVIQAVALAELSSGLTDPNAYGFLPLENLNPATPAIKEGPENDYWDHVDFVVNTANDLGLFIGFLPTWGSLWNDGESQLINEANAEVFGEFVGKRYKDKELIWILGGDRPVDTDKKVAIMRSLARGIRKAGAKQLITLHPPGGYGSAQWVHNEPWMDFNMRQNGHAVEFTGRYNMTYADYRRIPAKPVMDGEPVYEDHPIAFNPDQLGHTTAADVRRPLYWDLFTGAFGHTYGHHSVWQMYDPAKGSPINRPLMSWKEALDQPGAQQMMYGRKLIESRPFLSRIPDSTILVAGEYASAMPGEGRARFVATRDTEGTYAMIYTPVGREFKVRMDVIKGKDVLAWWYNPRNGTSFKIGVFANHGEQGFISPDTGEYLDWILVLDDASKQYPAPGLIH